MRANPEFSYDASGVTHATLTAAEQQVNVGNERYVSLVFNGDYDSPLIRTRPGGVMARPSTGGASRQDYLNELSLTYNITGQLKLGLSAGTQKKDGEMSELVGLALTYSGGY